jgi:hypothetical protein
LARRARARRYQEFVMPQTLSPFARVALTAAVTATMTLVVALPASAATTDPKPIPGAPDYVRSLINIDDVLYFAGGDGYLGTYDGSSFTLYDRPGDPSEVFPGVELGDDIVMQADAINSYGRFWTFDRTTEVFTEWGNTTDGPLIPTDFVATNGVAYFAATDGTFSTDALWKFDGTTVTEIAGATALGDVATFNGDVYMNADGVLTVYHPGTNTFTTDPAVLTPEQFTEYGGKLYWVAYPSGDQTLYEFTPGTNTTRVFDQPGDPVDPESLSVANGLLYLSGFDGSVGRMLSFDGSTFTAYPGAPIYPYGFTGFDGKVFFGGSVGSDTLLHWFDPATGTFHNFATPDEPFGFTVLGDRMFFPIDDGDGLWFIQIKALASTGVDAEPGVTLALGLLGAGAAAFAVTLIVRRRSRPQA